jgi:hypothetical protein
MNEAREYGLHFRIRMSAQESIEAQRYRQGWDDCLEYYGYQRIRQIDGGDWGSHRPDWLPPYPAVGIDGDEEFCLKMIELQKKPLNERIIPHKPSEL